MNEPSAVWRDIQAADAHTLAAMILGGLWPSDAVDIWLLGIINRRLHMNKPVISGHGALVDDRYIAHCGAGACNIDLDADGHPTVFNCWCYCKPCREMRELEKSY